MNLRPWEIIHKLRDNGFEAPTAFGGKCDKPQRKCERKWEKEERKCKRSQEGKEKSQGKWKHQKPSCEQKLSQPNLAFGSSERTEKGIILESLIGLFGSHNVKEYFNLIE